MTPYQVKHNIKGTIPVPCGKCPDCLGRRASGWSFRLIHEERRSESSLFITLTYAPDTVPLTSRGFMDLNKRDLQLFFKRLRKAHGSRSCALPIKYYAVGEYGGRTNRPHYHVILFNAQLDLIQPAWGNGDIHYGQVTGASVGYTLKYMCKPQRIPMHINDDRTPEFSLMSKRLGAGYINDQTRQWHKEDLFNRMYLHTDDNKKISMPRYYKNKMYTDAEHIMLANHHRQLAMEKIAEHDAIMRQKHGDNAIRVQVDIDKAKFAKLHRSAETGRFI